MRKKILIIDDDESFAEAVKFNLEETGKYEARIEEKGKNGLAVAREFRPDLILLDVIMPDMGGDKVVAQLKECGETKRIPIVFLTAIVTQEETHRQGGIVSGYPFIAKPVKIEKLLEIVEKNIG